MTVKRLTNPNLTVIINFVSSGDDVEAVVDGRLTVTNQMIRNVSALIETLKGVRLSVLQAAKEK